jgi:hypothetical protein
MAVSATCPFWADDDGVVRPAVAAKLTASPVIRQRRKIENLVLNLHLFMSLRGGMCPLRLSTDKCCVPRCYYVCVLHINKKHASIVVLKKL